MKSNTEVTIRKIRKIGGKLNCNKGILTSSKLSLHVTTSVLKELFFLLETLETLRLLTSCAVDVDKQLDSCES